MLEKDTELFNENGFRQLLRAGRTRNRIGGVCASASHSSASRRVEFSWVQSFNAEGPRYLWSVSAFAPAAAIVPGESDSAGEGKGLRIPPMYFNPHAAKLPPGTRLYRSPERTADALIGVALSHAQGTPTGQATLGWRQLRLKTSWGTLYVWSEHPQPNAAE